MAYFRCIGGGGESGTNILKGTSTPIASQGSNGQVYLKYVPSITSDLEKITNNSNDAYIPIGVIGNKYTKFVMKCNIHGGGSFATPIGARLSVSSSNMLLFFKYNGGNTAYYAVNSGDTQLGDITNFFDTDITITLSNDLVRVEDENGNYVEATPSNANDFSTQQMMIFNLGTGASSIYGSGTACYMDLYECKVYVNDNLEKYLLPKTENGVIGLVDATDGTFYPASGTVSGTARSTPLSFSLIVDAYAKVSGEWQNLIGTDIDDIS